MNIVKNTNDTHGTNYKEKVLTAYDNWKYGVRGRIKIIKSFIEKEEKKKKKRRKQKKNL